MKVTTTMINHPVRAVAPWCYGAGLGATISQRELRNDSGVIMRRVEQGESFTVTRNGRLVADLVGEMRIGRRRLRLGPIAQARQRLGVGLLPAQGVDLGRQDGTAAAAEDLDVGTGLAQQIDPARLHEHPEVLEEQVLRGEVGGAVAARPPVTFKDSHPERNRRSCAPSRDFRDAR